MRTLAELLQARAALVDQMEAIVAGTEGDLTEEQAADFDKKKGEVDKLTGQIGRLQTIERTKAAIATPRGAQAEGTEGGPAPVPASAKTPKEKGAMLSRLIVSLAANKGIPSIAAEWAAEKWGGEDGDRIAKTLAAGGGAAGGFVIPPDFSNELIEFLRPASVVMSLNPRIIDMPNGTFTLPGVAQGATAAYVGENTNLPKTQQTFRQVNLVAKKLGAVVPMSNDMLRYPTMAVDTFVRDDLAQAIAMRADLAMIRGDGTAFTPRGLRSYALASAATQVIAANATISLANTTLDLGRCRLAIRRANINFRRPGWIMSPRSEQYLLDVRDGNGNFAFRPAMEAQGTLLTFPYRVTTQIPENLGGGTNQSEIYLTEFAEFIIGDARTLEIEVFQGGTYHDGTNLVSGISQDQTVIRAIVAHDTGLRQDSAVVLMQGVTWGT